MGGKRSETPLHQLYPLITPPPQALLPIQLSLPMPYGLESKLLLLLFYFLQSPGNAAKAQLNLRSPKTLELCRCTAQIPAGILQNCSSHVVKVKLLGSQAALLLFAEDRAGRGSLLRGLPLALPA